MELFTDDDLLRDFCKNYNFKRNYILQGQYFGGGSQGQNASFLVEHSIGSMCYLRCYILYTIATEEGIDTIGLQSPFLDDVFRYKYRYLELVRSGCNLSLEPIIGYTVPFSMNGTGYESVFRLGHDNRFGLLEDFDRKGELRVSLQSCTLQECYDISVVWYRLAMFMTSHAVVPFKHITLYKNGWEKGWFYCPLVSVDAISDHEGLFYKLDVMKYIPKILNNIALEPGNRITKSIPLGHVGSYETMFSPHRFMEQIMSFEYLFDKLDHQRAQDKCFSLKNELEYMLNEFPNLLNDNQFSSSEASENIKEIRRTIAHGYSYYYDFKNDIDKQRLIILLDKLIRNMSLLWIGFTKDEIAAYPID